MDSRTRSSFRAVLAANTGVLSLKRLKQKVEIRVVLHRQTIGRLPQLAEFLVRNLLFVDHVALMGLEMTGFTRANLDLLWIDPYEYKDVLSEAVATLMTYGVSVSVYNHPLCVVNPDILPASEIPSFVTVGMIY